MPARFAIPVFALAGSLLAGAAAQAQTVYTLSQSAIECLEPIGGAPEMRELARRTNGADPGPMRTFVVRVGAATAADIRAAFDDIDTGRQPGFEQTRGGRIRLELFAPGIDTEAGGVTTAMPRDGFLMFTMVEGAVDHILVQRPRCSARAFFDKAPFEAFYRSQRDTFRGMLDQERR